jgi:hypothetical protein
MGRRNKRKNKKEKKAAKKAETETKMSSSERSGSREDFSTVDRLESFQPGPSSSLSTRAMEQVYQPHPARSWEVNVLPFSEDRYRTGLKPDVGEHPTNSRLIS